MKNEIKGFTRCLVEQILRFYCIQLKQNDIKKDLVENMVTNMIIKEDIYDIMYKLYTELNEKDIQLLKKIQDNQQTLNVKLNFEALKINNEFRMNPEFRENFPLKPESEIIHVEQDIFPFESVVQ